MTRCPGLGCLTWIPQTRELCHFHRRADMRYCRGCNRHRDLLVFPLGRPRHDGTRHPMRLCQDCQALHIYPAARESHREANREYMRRRRAELRVTPASPWTHRRASDGGESVKLQRQRARAA